MTPTLSRRDFLAYSGATIAGVTLGELGRSQLLRADERAGAWRGLGEERWATSVCSECPAACGVRVRLVDDVPVKLEGNPLCPIGRGRLCANGQAALESYFDPDRLVGPARRAGERGEGKWEPVTWEAAIDDLATHLRAPAGLSGLAIAAEQRGELADVWSRFWTAAGATVVWTPAGTTTRLRSGLTALTGVGADPLFDVEHASYVLSFGAPVVENWLSPVWAQRSYGRFRQSGSQPRGRLVQIEARRSLTARKADEWLGVPSSRQALLAYGIASALFRENRVDRTFLDEFGGNLSELEEAVVSRYTPDSVAGATGVPVVTILRMARELARSPRPLVIFPADAPPALVQAGFTLNALIGAIDRPGGVFVSPRTASDTADQVSVPAEDALRDGVRPRVIACRDAAWVQSISSATLDAMTARAELIVSFSPYLDEASAVAYLLRPMHPPLESWHARIPAAAVPADMIAFARPAVAPRLDTGDLVTVLAATAKAAGGTLAKAPILESSEALTTSALEQLSSARRGGPYMTVYESAWLGQLEHGGWWTPATATPAEFSEVVLEAGGWSDPFFEPGEILRSVRSQDGLRFVLPSGVLKSRVTGGETEGSGFPVQLSVFTPALVNPSGNPNQPILYELLGQPDVRPWQLWAELSPETAREYGIELGQQMHITSAHGSLDAVAVPVEGMPRSTVSVPFIPGGPSGGRWARTIARDARVLAGDNGVVGVHAVRIAAV